MMAMTGIFLPDIARENLWQNHLNRNLRIYKEVRLCTIKLVKADSVDYKESLKKMCLKIKRASGPTRNNCRGSAMIKFLQ